jgi:DNA repair exonuclease SbcCD ATPase subunit
MRLLKLSLENFKGIRRFTFEPQGKSVRLLGENASGKTSCADAFSWLLFGKDSLGRSDFEIKSLDKNGQALHGLDHAVEAVLEMDGTETTLRKAYREKWTKRRGSAEKEFTGHTKDHFIDGVPVTQSEYEERVALIGSEKVFRLLTNPVDFAERLHWQERRELLLQVCGDISDQNVIASTPDLADLTEILAGRSIDDHRKVAQAQKRKINEELGRVPIRIEEVSRNLPEGPNIDGAQDRVLALREERRAAEAELSRIETGGEVAEKTKRLREIESGLIEEANRAAAKKNEAVRKLRDELSDKEQAQAGAVRSAERIRKDIGMRTPDIERLEVGMKKLREEWYTLDKQTLEPIEGDDLCPTCGQTLPEDQVEAAREKAQAEFNSRKAQRLADIAEQGKADRARADEIKTEIEKWRREAEEADHAAKELQGYVEKLRNDLKKAESVVPEISTGGRQERHALEEEIEKVRNDRAGAVAAVSSKIEKLNQEIVGCEAAMSTAEQRRAGLDRIEQLKRQERRLYLCDEFTRCKVSMLTDRINSRFELARFKLFNVLVNGGIEECCEITYQGVPWSSLNTGAQVNIGLDVIRTLSEHYGVTPPIFVDHSESVTKLLSTPGQQIQLVVSESDKTLRMEEL